MYIGEWRCGGVAVWGSCGVEELRCGGVAVWGSRGVGQLRCGAVAVWGGIAVCEGRSGYQTLDHCVLGVSFVFRIYREKLII